MAEPIKVTFTPLDSNNNYKGPAKKSATPAMRSILPSTITSTQSGSQYDHGALPQTNLNEFRAAKQPWYDKMGNSLINTSYSAFQSAAEGTVGLLIGGAAALSTGDESQLYANGFSTQLDEWRDSLRESFPFYYSKAEKALDLSSPNFWFDKFANGLGYLAGVYVAGMGVSKAVGAMTDGLKKAKLASATNQAAETIGQIESTSRAIRGISMGEKAVVSAIVGSGEAAMEARETYNELVRKGFGREEAIAAANTNYLINAVVNGSLDFALFKNMLWPSYASKAKINPLVKEGDKWVDASLGKSSAARHAATNIFQKGLVEGGQEAAQFWSNFSIQSYMEKSREGNGQSTIANLMEAVNEGFSETFGTREGLEQAFIGFLLGGGTSAISGPTQQYKAQNERTASLLQMVNQDPSMGKLMDSLAKTAKVLNFSQAANQAKLNGDEHGYKNFSVASQVAYVQSMVAKGGEKLLRDRLEEVRNDQEQLREIFGIDMVGPMTEDQINEEINSALAIVDEVVKNNTIVDDLFPLESFNDEDYAAAITFKDNLVSFMTMAQERANRENGVSMEINQIVSEVYQKATRDIPMFRAGEQDILKIVDELEELGSNIPTFAEFVKEYRQTETELDKLEDIEKSSKYPKAKKKRKPPEKQADGTIQYPEEKPSAIMTKYRELYRKQVNKWLDKIDNIDSVAAAQVRKKLNEIDRLSTERESLTRAYNELVKLQNIDQYKEMLSKVSEKKNVFDIIEEARRAGYNVSQDREGNSVLGRGFFIREGTQKGLKRFVVNNKKDEKTGEVTQEFYLTRRGVDDPSKGKVFKSVEEANDYIQKRGVRVVPLESVKEELAQENNDRVIRTFQKAMDSLAQTKQRRVNTLRERITEIEDELLDEVLIPLSAYEEGLAKGQYTLDEIQERKEKLEDEEKAYLELLQEVRDEIEQLEKAIYALKQAKNVAANLKREFGESNRRLYDRLVQELYEEVFDTNISEELLEQERLLASTNEEVIKQRINDLRSYIDDLEAILQREEHVQALSKFLASQTHILEKYGIVFDEEKQIFLYTRYEKIKGVQMPETLPITASQLTQILEGTDLLDEFPGLEEFVYQKSFRDAVARMFRNYSNLSDSEFVTRELQDSKYALDMLEKILSRRTKAQVLEALVDYSEPLKQRIDNYYAELTGRNIVEGVNTVYQVEVHPLDQDDVDGRVAMDSPRKMYEDIFSTVAQLTTFKMTSEGIILEISDEAPTELQQAWNQTVDQFTSAMIRQASAEGQSYYGMVITPNDALRNANPKLYEALLSDLRRQDPEREPQPMEDLFVVLTDASGTPFTMNDIPVFTAIKKTETEFPQNWHRSPDGKPYWKTWLNIAGIKDSDKGAKILMKDSISGNYPVTIIKNRRSITKTKNEWIAEIERDVVNYTNTYTQKHRAWRASIQDTIARNGAAYIPIAAVSTGVPIRDTQRKSAVDIFNLEFPKLEKITTRSGKPKFKRTPGNFQIKVAGEKGLAVGNIEFNNAKPGRVFLIKDGQAIMMDPRTLNDREVRTVIGAFRAAFKDFEKTGQINKSIKFKDQRQKLTLPSGKVYKDEDGDNAYPLFPNEPAKNIDSILSNFIFFGREPLNTIRPGAIWVQETTGDVRFRDPKTKEVVIVKARELYDNSSEGYSKLAEFLATKYHNVNNSKLSSKTVTQHYTPIVDANSNLTGDFMKDDSYEEYLLMGDNPVVGTNIAVNDQNQPKFKGKYFKFELQGDNTPVREKPATSSIPSPKYAAKASKSSSSKTATSLASKTTNDASTRKEDFHFKVAQVPKNNKFYLIRISGPDGASPGEPYYEEYIVTESGTATQTERMFMHSKKKYPPETTSDGKPITYSASELQDIDTAMSAGTQDRQVLAHTAGSISEAYDLIKVKSPALTNPTALTVKSGPFTNTTLVDEAYVNGDIDEANFLMTMSEASMGLELGIVVRVRKSGDVYTIIDGRPKDDPTLNEQGQQIFEGIISWANDLQGQTFGSPKDLSTGFNFQSDGLVFRPVGWSSQSYGDLVKANPASATAQNIIQKFNRGVNSSTNPVNSPEPVTPSNSGEAKVDEPSTPAEPNPNQLLNPTEPGKEEDIENTVEQSKSEAKSTDKIFDMILTDPVLMEAVLDIQKANPDKARDSEFIVGELVKRNLIKPEDC